MLDATETPARSWVVTARAGADGHHVVHATDCAILPHATLIPLGRFADPASALTAAQRRFDHVGGCALCRAASRRTWDPAAFGPAMDPAAPRPGWHPAT